MGGIVVGVVGLMNSYFKGITRCVVFCYIVLCYILFCSVALYCIVLNCIVLCCGVLNCVEFMYEMHVLWMREKFTL